MNAHTDITAEATMLSSHWMVYAQYDTGWGAGDPSFNRDEARETFLGDVMAGRPCKALFVEVSDNGVPVHIDDQTESFAEFATKFIQDAADTDNIEGIFAPVIVEGVCIEVAV